MASLVKRLKFPPLSLSGSSPGSLASHRLAIRTRNDYVPVVGLLLIIKTHYTHYVEIFATSVGILQSEKQKDTQTGFN